MSRYSCWTTTPTPKGGAKNYTGQHGWTDDGRRVTKPHTTDWLPVKCGHMTPETDPECTGCALRGHGL